MNLTRFQEGGMNSIWIWVTISGLVVLIGTIGVTFLLRNKLISGIVIFDISPSQNRSLHIIMLVTLTVLGIGIVIPAKKTAEYFIGGVALFAAIYLLITVIERVQIRKKWSLQCRCSLQMGTHRVL